MECKSPDIIRQKFGYVDQYVPNTLHNYKEVRKHPKGTWSDDMQLTLTLMDSIGRCKGYDLFDLRQAHIEALDGKWGEPVGWGSSTRNSVHRMKQGIADAAEPLGAGNGPVIKITPLAIYAVYQTIKHQVGRFTNSFNASLLKKCSEIALLTHGNPICFVAAYCQARMVIRAMQNEIPQHLQQIVKLFISDAQYAESKQNVAGLNECLSARFIEILMPENFDLETRVVSKKICTSASAYVLNSYALVAYCVAKYLPYRNFSYAITQTINAGADADSNGSMVGAIMGAHLGIRFIPKHWLSGIRSHAFLEKQIVSFVNTLAKL